MFSQAEKLATASPNKLALGRCFLFRDYC